jgi:hypothetical protein
MQNLVDWQQNVVCYFEAQEDRDWGYRESNMKQWPQWGCYDRAYVIGERKYINGQKPNKIQQEYKGHLSLSG